MQARMSIKQELIGSWLSEIGYTRTMRGYTFYSDGSGRFFIWYSHDNVLTEIIRFSYKVDLTSIILVFDQSSYQHIIPFEIEEEKLLLKRDRKEIFKKNKAYKIE